MDPALLNYMQSIESQQQQQPQQYQGQQPQEQQQMPPQEGSPFMNGANAAIQAAKQSLGMNQQEKQRAEGLAIMSFFSNLSKGGYGSGLNGRLAGITQSLNPAVQAYMQEQNNVAALNSQLQSQYAEQQQQQEMMQQKMAHQQEAQAYKQAQLEETRRSHEAMEQHRAAQLGLQHGYHKESLALKRAGLDLKRGAERQQKTGKPPPQLISKLAKDIEKLEGATQELKAYDAAENLLLTQDPLYNPVAQGAFSIIGGRPPAFKSPAQADFEALESTIRRKKFKGSGLRTQIEYQDIKTIDPRLSKEANLAIIEREKNALKPILEKKAKLEELHARLVSGENIDLDDYSHYLGSSPAPSQAQSMQQDWVLMKDPQSGEEMHVPLNNVATAESRGAVRVQ